MSRSPSPSPATPDLSTVLHGVWTGMAAAVAASPVLGVFLVLFALSLIVRAIREVIHGGYSRDPARLFSRSDKALILARAGNRCERHILLVGRCRETSGLEADHVHPWSRGGQTGVANGQALCPRHNRQKRAIVPYAWQIRALEKRRDGYSSVGVSTVVVRHRSRRT